MWRRSRRLAWSGESGFALMETVAALVLLEIIAMAAVGLITVSLTTEGNSRQRVLAEQIAASQIEAIRQLPYTSVGLVNGNPGGTVAATKSISIGALSATRDDADPVGDRRHPERVRHEGGLQARHGDDQPSERREATDAADDLRRPGEPGLVRRPEQGDRPGAGDGHGNQPARGRRAREPADRSERAPERHHRRERHGRLSRADREPGERRAGLLRPRGHSAHRATAR